MDTVQEMAWACLWKGQAPQQWGTIFYLPSFFAFGRNLGPDRALKSNAQFLSSVEPPLSTRGPGAGVQLSSSIHMAYDSAGMG